MSADRGAEEGDKFKKLLTKNIRRSADIEAECEFYNQLPPDMQEAYYDYMLLHIEFCKHKKNDHEAIETSRRQLDALKKLGKQTLETREIFEKKGITKQEKDDAMREYLTEVKKYEKFTEDNLGPLDSTDSPWKKYAAAALTVAGILLGIVIGAAVGLATGVALGTGLGSVIPVFGTIGGAIAAGSMGAVLGAIRGAGIGAAIATAAGAFLLGTGSAFIVHDLEKKSGLFKTTEPTEKLSGSANKVKKSL